jgi:GTPase SAR1 family protein
LVSVTVFAGMAGSGKTSIVAGYSKWLKTSLFARVASVNLDPGVETLPYTPVFDIRKYFTLRDLMKKYGVGPNAAFLKSAEMISYLADKIMSEEPFSNLDKWDYVLIDTPGQLEAFIFQPEAREFLARLSSKTNLVVGYLIDSSMISSIPDAVTSWFMYVLIQVKTGLLTVPIISKADLARNPSLLKDLIENPSALVSKEYSVEGLQAEIIPELIQIAMKTKGALRVVMVSIHDDESFRSLHNVLQEAFCACGDLT